MAANGSTKVIVAALGANLLIAATKFAAAVWTGSAAMLSEAIHSLADTANQGLLLHGVRRSARPPDERHPFGYGREIYFWAFVVAVLLFSLGAGVAIYEGVAKLRDPHPVTDPWINYAILITAIVFEAASTAVALREMARTRGNLGWFAAVRASKDPGLFTVLLENLAAIAGLLVALAGIASAHLLGFELGDAIASIVIGIILGFVAAFMSMETKALLIGEAAAPEIIAEIRNLIEAHSATSGPARRLLALRTMHLGPDDILVTASIDFKDEVSATTVEATVASLEAQIKARYPAVRHLYLEARPEPAHAASPASAQTPAIPIATVAMQPHGPIEPSAPVVATAAAGSAVETTNRAGSHSLARSSYPPPKKGKKKRRR